MMRELLYALRFTGQATPVGSVGHVLTVATTAPSSSLTATVGSNGLVGCVHAVDGDRARFASEVTFTSETSFQEIGTITFGEGNILRFSTVGSGYLNASADPARTHGTVMWRVDGGDGQFAGATGLITSNFFVSKSREITDHHVGVLFLPQADRG